MQSIRTLYNDELVEAHREAVATLRELLSEEKDPLERRKLANAILRARPAKDDAPSLSREAGEGGGGSATPGEGALPPTPTRRTFASHAANLDDANDFDDPNDPTHREIDNLAYQAQHGPDRLAALGKLHAIMTDNMAALAPSASASEST